jgi:hypothetical protein
MNMNTTIKGEVMNFLKAIGFKQRNYYTFIHPNNSLKSKEEVIVLPKGRLQERHLHAIHFHLEANCWTCATRFKELFIGIKHEINGHPKMRSMESISMMTMKKGDFFYSHKQDRALTAIANCYKKKIRTERLIILNPNEMTVDRIVKVTLL